MGKTTSFKDFDEMVKWALSNNGVLDNYTYIKGNLSVRHILDTVGAVFILSNPIQTVINRIVTSDQVYNLLPYERKDHLISIFYIDQIDDLKTI